MLSKSWFFRFSTLAFIVLITPILGIPLRTPTSALIILVLSALMGFIENSFGLVLQRFSKVVAENKLLLYFLLWYLFGLTINLLVGGRGLADWRLLIMPIILFIGIFFAFAFMSDNTCARYLQISIILVLGMQSLITIPKLYLTPSIARQMWLELSGSWIYGSQTYFSTCAVLLPTFVWRSFKETSLLRLVLLACSFLILVSASISSFATPLGLIAISFIITFVLASLFMIRRKGCLIALLLILISYSGYQFISSNLLFSDSYTRMTNFINNPKSGGYSGRELAVSRWDLDAISVESFWESPLFGMGGGSTRYSEYVGGHSSLLDALGAYGILGGGGALVGWIAILLINSIKRFLHERSWQALLALATVISFVIAGIVNPYWEGSQPLFVILIARPFKWNSYFPFLEQ